MEQNEVQAENRKVRFAEVGNRDGIVEVDLGPGQGLQDLLKARGVSVDRQVRVNNGVASETTELKDGDLVMALPRVVGG